MTLTEGTDLARWTSSTSGATSGTVVIDCPLTNTPVTCNQNAHDGGQVRQTQATVAASDISYQAVDVTATRKDKKDKKTTEKNAKQTVKETTTVTPTPTSEGGAAEMTGRSWVGAVGAVGAGVVALAAL
ncbi:uncharacterized protein LTR77_003376 [Saxophila tyrrhenica]|uniref:Uncharacterized protein n=1 Tax=Saxophila tyrrhenica TaxID=1690608 RepID=A0AAV9PDS8_9PEZI|nr:hypothetical protein LTR77_003376 [Saxophila tyrrhenica]